MTTLAAVIGQRRLLAHVTKTFNSPISQTWAIWSSFGAAHLYIIGCSFVKLEGHGVGAIRTLAFGRSEVCETLQYVDANSHTYAYTINNSPGLPARNSLGLIQLQEEGGWKTKITWKGYAEEVTPGAEDSLRKQLVGLYNGSIEKARGTLEGPLTVTAKSRGFGGF